MNTAVLSSSITKPTVQPKHSITKTTSPKSSQMNIRMQESIKERGEKAFAHIGLTPSEAVRKLWDFAARHENDPKALQGLIAELDEVDTPEEAAQLSKLESLQEIDRMRENLYSELGITPAPLSENDAERIAYYEELAEQYYDEKLQDWGQSL